MIPDAETVRCVRRAWPLLGTLVEAAVFLPQADALAHTTAAHQLDAAREAIMRVERHLSRFLPDSDVARFNAAAAGSTVTVDRSTATVLGAAQQLCLLSHGVFDPTCGTAPDGWSLARRQLTKHAGDAVLDLGGIAKGYAVDRAVRALQHQGVRSGWVNAGGDLRVFGEATVPVLLRDEVEGGTHHFATLGDGAWASSHFSADSHSVCWSATGTVRAHVSVAAPRCLWADALTKVVAATGDACHPALQWFGAHAWLH